MIKSVSRILMSVSSHSLILFSFDAGDAVFMLVFPAVDPKPAHISFFSLVLTDLVCRLLTRE